MFEPLIVDLLLSSLETEDDFAYLIESQLKCLTGQTAETPLDLTA